MLYGLLRLLWQRLVVSESSIHRFSFSFKSFIKKEQYTVGQDTPVKCNSNLRDRNIQPLESLKSASLMNHQCDP